MLASLYIAALALQIGNCYVIEGNDGDTNPLLVEVAVQETCKIADLNLTKTEDVTDCFPNKARNGVVHDKDICYISSGPPAGKTESSNTRLEESQTGVIKCHHGTWMHHELGQWRSLHKRKFIGAAIGVLSLVGIICSFFCGISQGGSGGTFAVSTTRYDAPKFSDDPCKPSSVQDTYYPESGETGVVVTWEDPEATDSDSNVPLIITQPAGFTSGSVFEGSTTTSGMEHHITYQAMDNDGLSAYCHFSFVVKVYSCGTAPWPANGQRSCDKGSILGSVCTYNCTSGYELSGNSTITCQGSPSPSWTLAPTCSVKSCPEPPTINNGMFTCSNFTYQSTCTLNCDSGYTFSGNSTYHIQCQADGNWSSISTYCKDTSPPIFDSCPTVELFYADRGLTSSIAEWTEPTATDELDGSVVPQQIEGLPYGSVFPVGSSTVVYSATDSEGNQSQNCTIIITIEETICRHPLDTLQDSYMDFSCNSSTYTYGVECGISCKFNYHLIGTSLITCEQNSTNLAEGYWSWGFGDQPSCNVTDCPSMEAPVNGGLTVGYAGTTKIVNMFCNSEFTIPEIFSGFTGQWVCLNSGLYTPSIDVPDCTSPVDPWSVKLLGDLYYYDGNCSDEATQEQIRSNLQQIMDTTVNPIIQTLCAEHNCTITDVVVICGEVSGRKKRDAISQHHAFRTGALPYHRNKRQSSQPTAILGFALSTVITYGNMTSQQALYAVHSIQVNAIKPALEELTNNGTLDLPGLTTGTIEMAPYGVGQCNQSYYFNGVKCVPCPSGYFLNTASRCELCSVGTYSDKAGLTVCKTCQTGYTTLQTGSKNESQCIELCPAGQYSVTGTIPCSLCAVGFYQNGTGQTSCIQCISGTTESSGSVSSSACKTFQVLVNNTNEVVTAGSVSSMSNVTLMFWTKKYSHQTSNAHLRLKSGGNDRVIVYQNNNITVQVSGSPSFNVTVGTLSSTIWSHVTVTWDTTNDALLVYHNGQLYSNESNVAAPESPVISNGTVQLESTGTSGVYLTDLHLEDAVLSSSEIQTIAGSCWTDLPNDVFSLNSLRDTNVQGIEIQTPPSCDPIDECASDPCNGHNCANLINDYVCTCSNGWSGENCMTPPNMCIDVVCANGGTCISNITEFICTCVEGYTGDLCEVAPVDGGWSDWSDWTSCTTECDGGTQNRSRSCDSPVPSTYGADCVGDLSEIQACNQEACPTCPDLQRSFGLYKSCTDTTEGSTCVLSCRTGYVLPVNSPSVYTCGRNTSYEWKPNANPPTCEDPNMPSSIDLFMSTLIAPTVTADNIRDVEQEVTANLLANIQCLDEGTCSHTVEIDGTSRKRSTGSTIGVTLSVTLTETGSINIQDYIQTSNASAPLLELIDGITNMETAAAYINTSSSIFDVTVNGVTYTHDPSTLTISGNVSCPVGQTAIEGVCVYCTEGTYYVDGYCIFCGTGTYSSSPGQTSCTDCPAGFTTSTIGSYAESQCSVTVTSTVTLTTSLDTISISSTLAAQNTYVETKSSSNHAVFIGIGIAGLALIISISVCVFVVYKKPCSKKRRVGSATPQHIRSTLSRQNTAVTLADIECEDTMPALECEDTKPALECEHTFVKPTYNKTCNFTVDFSCKSSSPPPPYQDVFEIYADNFYPSKPQLTHTQK